jgi:hypothetical protein
MQYAKCLSPGPSENHSVLIDLKGHDPGRTDDQYWQLPVDVAVMKLDTPWTLRHKCVLLVAGIGQATLLLLLRIWVARRQQLFLPVPKISLNAA